MPSTAQLVVRALGGAKYAVVSGKNTYTVDAGSNPPCCGCDDYRYRPTTRPCKHGWAVVNFRAEPQAKLLDAQTDAQLLDTLGARHPSPKFAAWASDRIAKREAGLLPPLPSNGNGKHDAPLVQVAALTHIGDLLAEPEDPVRWIVEGLLPAGGMSIFASKPKAGKSTTARALALAVARGVPFLGRPTESGPVLYLGLEDPRRITRGHFQTLGATKDDDLFVHTGKRPTEALLWLKTMLEEHDPVLVIVDTQQRMTGISDLNDYAKVTAALEPIMDLVRDRRAHLMLLHHCGKGDRVGFDAVLGSIGFQGTVDVILLLQRKPDHTRTLASLQRMGDDLPESILVLDARCEPQLGPPKAEYELAQLGDKILAFLDTQTDPAPRVQVLEAIEAQATSKVRALQHLVADGKVTKTGTGRKGDPFLFCRSRYTPGTAERNVEIGTLPSNGAAYAVPEKPPIPNREPIPGNGICPRGHKTMEGLCPECEPQAFLAALEREAASLKATI